MYIHTINNQYVNQKKKTSLIYSSSYSQKISWIFITNPKETFLNGQLRMSTVNLKKKKTKKQKQKQQQQKHQKQQSCPLSAPTSFSLDKVPNISPNYNYKNQTQFPFPPIQPITLNRPSSAPNNKSNNTKFTFPPNIPIILKPAPSPLSTTSTIDLQSPLAYPTQQFSPRYPRYRTLSNVSGSPTQCLIPETPNLNSPPPHSNSQEEDLRLFIKGYCQQVVFSLICLLDLLHEPNQQFQQQKKLLQNSDVILTTNDDGWHLILNQFSATKPTDER